VDFSNFEQPTVMHPTNGDDSLRDDGQSLQEGAHQFGAFDIVEAFTAMRHEWRGQTKESRALVEQVESAVARFESLEAKLCASAEEDRPDDSSAARQLALHLVDADHQLSRAIAAMTQLEANRRQRYDADEQAVGQYFAAMSALGRWFAQPLLKFIATQRPAGATAEDPAIEGLNLVLARLRRALADSGIERIETEHEPFDAETMRAIGTVDATDCPSGCVAEQLTPGYRWRDRMLRFADVRVAK
jgi:molecular chaperone GrpE